MCVPQVWHHFVVKKSQEIWKLDRENCKSCFYGMIVRTVFLQILAEADHGCRSSQFDHICSSPKLVQSPECTGRVECRVSWLRLFLLLTFISGQTVPSNNIIFLIGFSSDFAWEKKNSTELFAMCKQFPSHTHTHRPKPKPKHTSVYIPLLFGDEC